MAGKRDRYDDPWESKVEAEEKRQEKRQRRRGISRADSVAATFKESMLAGKYVRRTFTWTPGQLVKLKQVADEIGMTEASTARWLMDVALTAYDNGSRPEVEETRRAEPRLKEW